MAWIKGTRQNQIGRQSTEGEMFEAGPLRDLCLQGQVEAEEDRKRLRKERQREQEAHSPEGRAPRSSGSWSRGGSLEAGGSRGASVRSLDTILRASGGLLEVSF